MAKRSLAEKLFLIFYFPSIIGFYLIYKFPLWFMEQESITQFLYWGGKSISFWYITFYTSLVVGICLWILIRNKSPYSKGPKRPLSNYQKWKFIFIAMAQLFFFYLIPFFIPWIIKGGSFFGDSYSPVHKDNYIYMYNGLTSWTGFVYLFVIIPIVVWFFGKRYCSWFCACGNLAETVGVTPWGKKWVEQKTPRGERSVQLEWLQFAALIFALILGGFLVLDGLKVVAASSITQALYSFQELAVDFLFASIIGVGAYPIYGTRIWCRYGCPMAQFMRISGKFTRSRSVIQADEKCKGLGLCSIICPMGIDVEKYAHKNKIPVNGQLSLKDSPCIGCGSCIDICPMKALHFKKVFGQRD
ncbi:MAG: 4Fe-4S binding protein [Bacteriovoracaceae bacterium]|nr:4Fe-4S binding protein [Bacteriovoracaceae bacterium]